MGIAPPVLSFRNISHRFNDGGLGLDAVSLDIHSGELLILAGSNGAGKTLLMRHANGLMRPSSGEVLYKGKPLSGQLRLVRRKIGLVFQHPEDQIIEDSVYAEIAFGPENLGIRKPELDRKVNTMLNEFKLEHLATRHPLTLSGGEKRRLALASVLVMEPELLLLDEPFMELDYPGIKDLLNILIGLHRNGQGMCIITHDVGKILAHADQLAIMHAGKIVSRGPAEETAVLLEEYGVRNPCRNGAAFREATWL